jgi:hypothetical protein
VPIAERHRHSGDCRPVHPHTGHLMVYVACDVITGTAHAASAGEVDAVTWASLSEITYYILRPFYGPVQEYLDAALPGSRNHAHSEPPRGLGRLVAQWPDG